MKALVLSGLMAVCGCASRVEPPTVGEAPLVTFQRDVVPVIDRRCGTCHGVPEKLYRDAWGVEGPGTYLRWMVANSGRIVTDEQVRIAYDRLTRRRTHGGHTMEPIHVGAPALESPVVRAPLAQAFSGTQGHPEVFASPDDPDAQVLIRFVEREAAAATERSPHAPSEAEKFFAERVVPVLERKTCFSSNCHGTLAFNDLKLDPGIPALSPRHTQGIHARNRRAMLGDVTRLVNLGGDVRQSRQLLKSIPVEEGGVVHKGGNTFLRRDDPDYQVLLRWLELEAEEARAHVGVRPGEGRGILFVRRPRGAPERFLEDEEFLGGADLHLRDGETEVNLTAALHAGPADIRTPDVSYDARTVVFAMRRHAGEPFNIWELDLGTRHARQLTFSTSPGEHYRDPIYAPDPDGVDTDLSATVIAFVSNRAGAHCPTSPDGILGEAEGGSRTTVLDAERTEKPGTYQGRVLTVVRGTNVGEARRVVRHERGRLTVDRPFSSPVDTTTHYVIDTPARHGPCYDLYRMRRAHIGDEEATFRNTVSRMTWSMGQVRRPHVRSSGEIMFTTVRSGWQDGRPFFNGAIFRTHVDGSNFHTHNGNRSGVPLHSDNLEMANGLEVRIGRDADSRWGGMLMVSDHQFGPTMETNNPSDNLDHPALTPSFPTSQPRFVPGWVPVDSSAGWHGISEGGAYRDPWPLPDGSILVSHARESLDLADASASPDFDVVRIIPEPSVQSTDGFLSGKFRREVVVSGPDAELWPRLVAPRLKEPVRKTLKTEERAFGPPGKQRGFTGYAGGTPAVLEVFDLPLLHAFFEQVTPVGARPLADGTVDADAAAELEQVRYLRVVGARQAPGATELEHFIIAEVPVEDDGSVTAVIPSEVGFDLQSLNRDRMALRSPMRWLYAHPGERHTLSIPRALFPTVCSGCHGSLTGRPPDTFRRPDAVTGASRTVATWDSLLLDKRVANAGAETGAQVTVDFERDVLPLVTARCAGCHAGSAPAASFNLSPAAAFNSLRSLVDAREGRALRSALMEKLMGRELHAPAPLHGDRPHPSSSPLSPDEILVFTRWIDLGAPRHSGEAP
ncbi:MAG: hypothetical protein AB2A00_01365 [Myxococcota bacterium]